MTGDDWIECLLEVLAERDQVSGSEGDWKAAPVALGHIYMQLVGSDYAKPLSTADVNRLRHALRDLQVSLDRASAGAPRPMRSVQ